jgi:hypothetical protein
VSWFRIGRAVGSSISGSWDDGERGCARTGEVGVEDERAWRHRAAVGARHLPPRCFADVEYCPPAPLGGGAETKQFLDAIGVDRVPTIAEYWEMRRRVHGQPLWVQHCEFKSFMHALPEMEPPQVHSTMDSLLAQGYSPTSRFESLDFMGTYVETGLGDAVHVLLFHGAPTYDFRMWDPILLRCSLEEGINSRFMAPNFHAVHWREEYHWRNGDDGAFVGLPDSRALLGTSGCRCSLIWPAPPCMPLCCLCSSSSLARVEARTTPLPNCCPGAYPRSWRQLLLPTWAAFSSAPRSGQGSGV